MRVRAADVRPNARPVGTFRLANHRDQIIGAINSEDVAIVTGNSPAPVLAKDNRRTVRGETYSEADNQTEVITTLHTRALRSSERGV